MPHLQKIKLLVIGAIAGILISSTVALADNNPIKLIINGRQITTDVPPMMVKGRILVPARVIAENLNCNVQWDEQNNTVKITNNPSQSTTIQNASKEIQPSASNKDETKTYSIGQTIEFPKSKIKVTGVTYTDSLGGFQADSGKKFAVIKLDVWVSEPPKNSLEWHVFNFIYTFNLANGQQIMGGDRYTGESDVVEPGKWKSAIDAKEIPKNDSVEAIMVVDPISHTKEKVVLK